MTYSNHTKVWHWCEYHSLLLRISLKLSKEEKKFWWVVRFPIIEKDRPCWDTSTIFSGVLLLPNLIASPSKVTRDQGTELIENELTLYRNFDFGLFSILADFEVSLCSRECGIRKSDRHNSFFGSIEPYPLPLWTLAVFKDWLYCKLDIRPSISYGWKLQQILQKIIVVI